MYELVGQEYECPACARKYPWRAESAGRPVICACGASLVVPFHPGQADLRANRPPGPPPPEPEPDDSAEEEEAKDQAEIVLCPDCGASMRAGAIVCTQCGYHRPRPKNRIFRKRRQTIEAEADGNGTPQPARAAAAQIDHWEHVAVRPVRDEIVPLALAIGGLIIQICLLRHIFNPPLSFWGTLAMTPFLALLALSVVAASLAIGLILTPLLDLFFGPVVPLAMKMAAAVLLPASVGSLIYFLSGRGGEGIFVGWLAALALYLTLFRIYFQFDLPDAVLLIALICLAQALILGMVVWPLTQTPMPMSPLWILFKPVLAQSVITFIFAGVFILPHIKEPPTWP